MEMTDVWAALQREYRLLIRNKVNLLLGLVPPAIYMLLFASSISQVIPQISYQGGSIAYPDFIVPAILIMSMIAGATATAASVFQEEIGGMLLELWSYPMRQSSYILGKLLATTLLVFVQGLMMLAVALVMFGQSWPLAHVLALLLGIVCTSLSLNSLYLFMATQFRDQQIFMIAINILAPVLIFSSPSFYGVEQMPLLIQYLSLVNPVTYGIGALRDGLLYGLSVSWGQLLLLLGLAVIGAAGTTRSLLTRFRDL